MFPLCTFVSFVVKAFEVHQPQRTQRRLLLNLRCGVNRVRIPVTTIGVISDTHGLLRPEALPALRGSDYIIHAGDIGDPQILDELAAIAPVTAVRGNVDHGEWAQKIPNTNILVVGEVAIYVLHILEELDLKPEAAKFAAVVYGHSHVPKQEEKSGVLYFNPGSAGPRRFHLPVSVGRLTIERSRISAKIVLLENIADARTPTPGQ
jgi:putative phosphoesterase